MGKCAARRETCDRRLDAKTFLTDLLPFPFFEFRMELGIEQLIIPGTLFGFARALALELQGTCRAECTLVWYNVV